MDRIDLASHILNLASDFLHQYTQDRVYITLGAPALPFIFKEEYYSGLKGGMLEAFGRLFAYGLHLLVFPPRTLGHIVVPVERAGLAAHALSAYFPFFPPLLLHSPCLPWQLPGTEEVRRTQGLEAPSSPTHAGRGVMWRIFAGPGAAAAEPAGAGGGVGDALAGIGGYSSTSDSEAD